MARSSKGAGVKARRRGAARPRGVPDDRVRLERYRQIVENAREGIWVIDADRRTTLVNPAMARMLGYEVGALMGRPVVDLIVPEERAVALQRIERRRLGERHDVEVLLLRADGATLPVLLSGVPLLGDDGTYRGSMAIVTDLSDRKRAEAVERRLGRALRTISQCNETLVRAGDEGELLQRICDLIVGVGGYRMAWVGFPVDDEERTVRPVARAGVEQGYLEAARISWGEGERGGGPTGRCLRSGEVVVAHELPTYPGYEPWRDAAARRGYASSAALPLRVDGRVAGALMIYAAEPDAFDADEIELLRQLADDLAFGIGASRTRREREHMQAQLMLADRMSSMGMLAAGVAHEINNPLAYALANLELLGRDVPAIVAAAEAGAAPPPGLTDFEERLRSAREGVARVRDIVRDLKLFSRVDEESVGLVELHEVLDAAVRMVWNEIRHRGRLVRDYRETPLVRANEARLGQVALNLLTNAVQALPEKWSERNEIRVVSRTDGEGRAVMEISDTGVGIPAAQLARIFEPFFTTKPVGVGTGLGLPICQTIVTALGGEILVESTPGAGATFRVVLPPAMASVAAAARDNEPRPSPAARRGRVLVVDDEAAMCQLLRGALAAHEVDTETDAAAALARVAAGTRYDVIFCDMMMPQMTGAEFHSRLAASAPDEAAKVVFMTGGAFTQSTRDFLASVPNARLEKPFDLQTLQALVRERLG